MESITTPDVRLFTSHRLDAGASNGEVNRELTLLKRAYSLAIQAGKLFAKPHIPLLYEDNIRTGFFEPHEDDAVLRHLPRDLAMLVRFLCITGWRIGEVLSLQWRQVDVDAGEVRLDPGTTKNRQGRTGSAMMAVPIVTESSFDFRRTEPLFPNAGYGGGRNRRFDVGSDGRFLMERFAADELVVILNWLEELKERVPVN